MASLLSVLAPVRITLSGIPSRWPMAVATVGGIALMVAVLLGFLAMAEGFTRALTGAGSPSVAVIVGTGARSEPMSVLPPQTVQLIETHVLNAGVVPGAISVERVRVAPARLADGSASSIVVRGVYPAAAALRPQRRSVGGGSPATPREGEVVLGRAVARQLGVTGVGTRVRLGSQPWRVAGIFEAGGTALESEAWVEAEAFRAAFPDQTSVQSLRLPLADARTLDVLASALATDARLNVRAEREDRFFNAQSAGLAKMVRRLAWPLAIAMAIGALAGALNTMFSSVAARGREIATLRAIGFGPAGTFVGTFVEAMLLAALGALFGAAIAAVLLTGRTVSTLAGGAAEVSFAFALSPDAIGAAFGFALLVGALGGAAPALRAARQPILTGLKSDV